MDDIWNEIFLELDDCIKKDVSEKDYESAICYCLKLLGWKKYNGEIVTQYHVQAGHETKLADIVVLQDGAIVEEGTHNELIAKKGVYSHLCELQTFS